MGPQAIDRNLALRIASRFMMATSSDELKKRMHSLLSVSGDIDLDEAVRIGRWFEATFRVKSPKTPKGTKSLKELAQKFGYTLVVATGWKKTPEVARTKIEELWKELEPQIGMLNKFYTDEEGIVVPNEKTVGPNHYTNPAGLDEKTFEALVKRIEEVFGMLSGWGRKALSGGINVIIGGPKDMPGGRVLASYHPSSDTVKIRATPQVLSKSFEETLIHELGHRYENIHHGPRLTDPKWYTTEYSRIGRDEVFAELFMLSEMGTHGPWDTTVENFNNMMSKM